MSVSSDPRHLGAFKTHFPGSSFSLDTWASLARERRPSRQKFHQRNQVKASRSHLRSLSSSPAPTPVVFSELAFLNKPSHQVTTAEDDERSERSGPSTSGRSSRPQSDKVDVTDGQIPPKEDNEGQASSAPLGQTQGPLARPQSIVWDIESQNDCLSDPVQSDAGLAATSIALNLRSSHWFAPPGPGKMDEQAIHSKPSPPQPIRMSSRSHSLPEVRERCNSGGDDQSTSLHPSHSASQGGYRQQCHSPERVTLLHSRPSVSRLVAPSPVPDAVEAPHVQVLGIPDGELDIGRVQTGILPFVDSFLEVPRSISAYHMEPPEIPSGINDNHVNEICRQPARTCARPFHFRSPAAQLREATSSVSFENDALEYYQTTGEQEHFSDLSYDPNNCPPFDWLSFCDPVAPRYEGESVGVVNDFGTAHDIDFARDLDVPDDYDYDYVGELNLRDFEQNVAGGHELEHGYGSEYGTVEDIDYFESQYDDPNASGDEVDFHESDQGELQNVITVDEDPEDDQPLAPALFEGRALLLGFSTSIGRQRSGLSDAEVDVAKRLHSHWRPQKL